MPAEHGRGLVRVPRRDQRYLTAQFSSNSSPILFDPGAFLQEKFRQWTLDGYLSLVYHKSSQFNVNQSQRDIFQRFLINFWRPLCHISTNLPRGLFGRTASINLRANKDHEVDLLICCFSIANIFPWFQFICPRSGFGNLYDIHFQFRGRTRSKSTLKFAIFEQKSWNNICLKTRNFSELMRGFTCVES